MIGPGNDPSVKAEMRDRMRDRKLTSEREVKNEGNRWETVVYLIVLALSFSGVVWGGYLLLSNAGRIKESNAVIVCMSGVTFTGCALFWVRKFYPIYYGVFEILTAIVITGFTIKKATDDVQSTTFEKLLGHQNALLIILGLFSSVYIVVRGFDNIDRGIVEWKKLKASKVRNNNPARTSIPVPSGVDAVK